MKRKEQKRVDYAKRKQKRPHAENELDWRTVLEVCSSLANYLVMSTNHYSYAWISTNSRQITISEKQSS